MGWKADIGLIPLPCVGRYPRNYEHGPLHLIWTHPDYPSAAVRSADLESVERRLKTRLPSDYKSAILEFGILRPSIELFGALCDRQIDLRDVSDFLHPDEIVEETGEWRDLGLPEELFAFAKDSSMGNLFCFSSDLSGGDLRPVLFWNHNSKGVDTVASSFSSWIEDFCRLAPN